MSVIAVYKKKRPHRGTLRMTHHLTPERTQGVNGQKTRKEKKKTLKEGGQAFVEMSLRGNKIRWLSQEREIDVEGKLGRSVRFLSCQGGKRSEERKK